MSYVTLGDLIQRYGEQYLLDLTDRDESGVIDVVAVEAAIAGADSLIDGYLSRRYALPLAVVPPMVVDAAMAIVRRRLCIHMVPDNVKADYEDAMRSLKDMGAGALTLPGLAGVGGTVQAASNCAEVAIVPPGNRWRP